MMGSFQLWSWKRPYLKRKKYLLKGLSFWSMLLIQTVAGKFSILNFWWLVWVQMISWKDSILRKLLHILISITVVPLRMNKLFNLLKITNNLKKRLRKCLRKWTQMEMGRLTKRSLSNFLSIELLNWKCCMQKGKALSL